MVSLEFVVFVLCVVAVVVLGPLLLTAASIRWTRRRYGARAATAVGAVLVLVLALSPLPRVWAFIAYYLVPPVRLPLASADLALSRPAREEVVRLVASKTLRVSGNPGSYEMPDGARGLSVWVPWKLSTAAVGSVSSS